MMLAVGDQFARLSVWNASVRPAGRCLKVLEPHPDEVESAVAFPSGDAVAASSYNNVLVWDLTAGTEGERGGRQGPPRKLQADGLILGLAISPRGDSLVSVSKSAEVKVWCTATWECTLSLRGHSPCTCVDIFPAGDRVVVGQQDGFVQVWGLASGRCLHDTLRHASQVRAVAVFPDGDWVASGCASEGENLKIWSLSSGDTIASIAAHVGGTRSISISPAGDKVVSAPCSNSAIKVWATAHWECIREFAGHADEVCGVEVSADGDTVVSASQRSVQMWSISTGRCSSRLKMESPFFARCVAIIRHLPAAPLQLVARPEPGGSLVVTCTNLAGEVLGEISGLTPDQPFSALEALVLDQIEAPGVFWKLTIVGSRDGEPEADASLGELFKLHDARPL